MTLFLAGGGNEKQSFAIDREFTRRINKVLYIPLAFENDKGYTNCLKWFTNCMKQHKELLIDMLIDPYENINLEKYDALYIGGGNTFKLLKLLQDAKLDKKIIEYFCNGGIIYGGSAGAIILGKDIEVALLCKDKDTNKVGLEKTKALTLFPFDVQCHYEDDQLEEHKDYVNKTKRTICAIPEESGIVVERGCFKVIGEKPITVITKNSYKKYMPNEEIVVRDIL